MIDRTERSLPRVLYARISQLPRIIQQSKAVKRLQCLYTGGHEWVDIFSISKPSDAVAFSYKRRCIKCDTKQFAEGFKNFDASDRYEGKPYKDK